MADESEYFDFPFIPFFDGMRSRVSEEVAMITLRQMEALHWISELGTFERAALRLNTSQSAISKRIQELESAAQIEIFDRRQRRARLTEKGAHLATLAAAMVELRDEVRDVAADGDSRPRRLRLGVTELTALTWLPRLVADLRLRFPKAQLHPVIDLSRNLFTSLLDRELDVIVIPSVFSDASVVSVPLADVSNVWMASADLVGTRNCLTLAELGELTVITQGSNSGSGLHFERWLKARGVKLSQEIASNSLIASIGLTLAGIGVSYLPQQAFRPLVASGKLVRLTSDPEPPPVAYAAMYRKDRRLALADSVIEVIQLNCDFSRQFQS
jgi:DNA-binding transcriptional LysR family regulator